MAGYSKSDISGDKTENCIGNSQNDFWVIKLDSAGDIQWQNTIGGNQEDVLYSAELTSDGGYILGGYSRSGNSGDKTENNIGSGSDYWVVKLNSLGYIQWQNTIGGSSDDLLFSINQTSDFGYILGGVSSSDSSGDKTENSLGWDDYWIVKIDSLGIVQWDNTIGGDDKDWLYSIKQTFDGGYILGGESESDSSGDKTENTIGAAGNEDYWVLKLDQQGNIQWQNTIGGNGGEWLLSIEQTLDGGFILGGSSFSNISGDKTENCLGDWDYWVIKLDSSGGIEWQNTIGGSDWDWITSIHQITNNEYIVSGYSRSNISFDKTENCFGNFDYWIINLDSMGNILWENTIGGDKEDQLYSIFETNNGEYILAGRSYSDISGDKTENTIGLNGYSDYWIVKLAPDTITGIFNSPLERGQGCVISPNPLATVSTITFHNLSKEKFLFTLYDITGRQVESITTINDKIILEKGSKQPGVYSFNLVNEKTGEKMNGKIMVSD